MNKDEYLIGYVSFFVGRTKNDTIKVIPYIKNSDSTKVKIISSESDDMIVPLRKDFEGIFGEFADSRAIETRQQGRIYLTGLETFYCVEIKTNKTNKSLTLCSADKKVVNKKTLFKYAKKIEKEYSHIFKKDPLDYLSKSSEKEYIEF